MNTTLQPVVVQDVAAQLDAALHRVAIGHIADRAFLSVRGPDAARWLNGMVTNSIATLESGHGNYNFILNAQGRILGDCTIYRESEAEAFLLATDASQLDSIRQHLEKFIIMDDVELVPAPTDMNICVLVGPNAPELVRRYYRSARNEMQPDLAPLRLSVSSEIIDQIITSDLGLVPRIEIAYSEANRMSSEFVEMGAVQVSPEVLESLRILSGTPRYGVDIRNTDSAHDLPQETGQTRALHFAKGCYLGQEIVERIRSRGNVHRTFSGFRLEGTLPTPGSALLAEGKPVGELTSVAAIPLPSGTLQLALGYVRREAIDRGLTLEYPGGTAAAIALPYAGID
jgi:folate-binding protein YgfZ